MNEENKYISIADIGYMPRMLTCVVITEFIFLLLVIFWPSSAPTNDYHPQKKDDTDIYLEAPVSTTQQGSPPPPPKPQVPIPVPNDEVIKEEIPTFDDVIISKFSDPLSKAKMGSQGEEGDAMHNAKTPPQIIKIVEATEPDQAKKAGIKAELFVRMLVNKQGEVEEAKIEQIKIFEGSGGSFKIVDDIGYGIKEAAIDAAREWKFHPARNNGEVVRAYTTQAFFFGY